MPGKRIFASAQDVETAFFEALEKADLDALMQLWSEDDEIVCIQPGGARLMGYAAIREAWRRLFEGGRRMQVLQLPATVVTTPFSAMHSLVVQVRLPETGQITTPLAVTNVFVRGALGWRLVGHHASPMPADIVSDGPPKVLH